MADVVVLVLLLVVVAATVVVVVVVIIVVAASVLPTKCVTVTHLTIFGTAIGTTADATRTGGPESQLVVPYRKFY